MTGIIGVTAMIVGISLGSLLQSEGATAQTVKASQLSPAAASEPAAYRMAPRFCPNDLEAAIASVVHNPRFRTATGVF